MLVKLLIASSALLLCAEVNANPDTSVPKEEPKKEKKVDKPDVHAPMSTFFLDRRPYMAPKKK